jgi:aminopeptidase N
LGDSLYPFLGNGGYDARHYTLELAVDVPGNVLTATTTLQAEATQALTAFNLDLHGLTVEQVTVAGIPAEFSRSGDELTITPTVALPAGALFTTTVAYHGTPAPLTDPAAGFDTLGWNHEDDLIYVVSEPSGAMGWYPVNNHPLDKATYTVQVTVDDPYVAVSNGVLASAVDHGARTTYTWEMAQPMASYLTAVVIGNFVEVEGESAAGVRIRHYFPRDRASALAPQFANTGEMVDFYADLLGPYPFAEYGVVVAPIPLGYALETQTMSLFGLDSTGEGVNAHELVHQWFGNDLALGDWQDIWLNEGFAMYLQRLWLERAQGREMLDSAMATYYKLLKGARVPAPGSLPKEELFSASAYERGAWVLHALRLEVGDDLFFPILREYYRRHAGGNATTADFIAAANEVSGRNLTDFLRAWIYDDELPPLPKR